MSGKEFDRLAIKIKLSLYNKNIVGLALLARPKYVIKKGKSL
ncbi:MULTISPECIES: hypothetical protein [unclassified Microcoleus]